MMKDEALKNKIESELFEIEKKGLEKADQIYKEVEQKFY
jgi:formiminotetrahydrofolate cyclodeaminase